MVKWILAIVGVVILTCGAAAYVALSAAPPAPSGACPAIFSDTPYDSNALLYFDVASLRNDEFAHRFDSLEKSMLSTAYLDFVNKTGFDPDRDIDHMLFSASFENLSGSLLLEGRFDQSKIDAYVSQLGTKKHFDSGDIYTIQTPGANNAVGLTFLDPTHMALSTGAASETQLLVIADAVKNPTPGLRDDMCALAQRVSGAPFFAVGNIPEKAKQQVGLLAARSTEPAAKTLTQITGWDFAAWSSGDAFHFSAEAQFDSRYDAFQALLAFKDSARNAHESLTKARTNPKGRPTSPADLLNPIENDLVNNFAFSLDGRYVRVGTWIKRQDVEKMLAGQGIGAH